MTMTDARKRRSVDEDRMKPGGADRGPGYDNWWPGWCFTRCTCLGWH